MPISSVTITPVTSVFTSSDVMLAEKGHLVAVSLFPESSGTGPDEYYGELWIVSTETPNPVQLICLVSGGFGKQEGLSWTGRLPCEAKLGVRANVATVADSLTPVKMAVFTEIP